MYIDLSIKARNTITECEKAIRRIPEVYRKELCEMLIDKFNSPQTYVFRHTDFRLHDTFHEICKLFNKLCDTEKEQFKEAFYAMCRQFGVQ